MKKLLVHQNRRYLMQEDGSPFFYLADTAWELFHRLTKEEARLYIGERSRQGFNVIQAVALSEFDGLRTPNAYGRCPLLESDGEYDPAKPDLDGEYSYWDHVDYIINTAAQYGIYIALLPTWGDKFNIKWGKGPEIFDEQNAYAYGSFIAKRYCGFDNIIWVLGGDRPIENDKHRAVIDAMGKAIRENDPNHLITYHPMGDSSSAEFVANKDYIDFHGTQTGHHIGTYYGHELIRKTFSLDDKPVLDLEPRYEDHPACFKPQYGYYWDASDVRQSAYYALMEGVCGHTYGNHCVWSMNDTVTEYFKYTWQDAILHDGAEQMRYLSKLRMSRPYFEFRPSPELICEESALNARQCSGRGDKYAFVYTPLGMPVRVYLNRLCESPVKASWFNPRNGQTQTIGITAPTESLFVPPSNGKDNDWVLILDVM